MFALIDRTIIWVTSIVVTLLMMTMVLAILLGVFYRYVLNNALPWPEELSRFTMIWVTMLGAGLLMRYGGHIAIMFLITRLDKWQRAVVMWMGRILVILLLIMLLWLGADMTHRTKRQSSAALEWSMAVPNFAIPLGAALMLYHIGVAIIRREDRGVPPPELPFI